MKANIGKIIREHRINKRMSQSDLAKQIGITSATVSAWELNKIFPPLPTFFELVEILNLPLNLETLEMPPERQEVLHNKKLEKRIENLESKMESLIHCT